MNNNKYKRKQGWTNLKRSKQVADMVLKLFVAAKNFLSPGLFFVQLDMV